MKVNIKLTGPQDDFIHSEATNPAIIGGLGSGKSRAGTIRIVYKLIKNKGCNVAYYMPTHDLNRLRAMPGVERDLEILGLKYRTNKSTFTITVFDYGDIIFRSYDNPERIIAYEVAHSIVDEIDTLSKDKAEIVWRKISERNRQSCNEKNTIGCVTTPDQGINGFVYHKWVKQNQDGYELIKASTLSNPFLPSDYVENIRLNYDPILADLYINGNFVSLNQNKVYHFFDRKKHNSDRVITDDDKFLYVGVDFNIGGVCAVTSLIDGDNNPVIVDEFVSHDTYDFVNNLRTLYRGKTLIVYPDASGNSKRTNATESDIGIIEREGYFVDYQPSNPAIRDRVNCINNLLSKNNIKINTASCVELCNSLESQGYDKRNDPEKYNDHPAIDDWNDALGYLCNGRWPVNMGMAAKINGYYR